MSLFKKKSKDMPKFSTEESEPVLRCSICTSEQVAGFRDKKTGVFTDVMLIRSPADLESFRAQYGIQEEIRRIY